MTASELLAKLENTRGSGGNWTARCPAHDDQRNSLKVSTTADRLLLHCHAGCTVETVVVSLGLEVADLFLEPRAAKPTPPAPTRRIVATYEYTDESGVLLFQAVRYEPKDFRQRQPDGNGGWAWNLEGVEPVPYRLPYLAMAEHGEQVWIASGEKDADALAELGLIATTNPMGEGCGKWRESFNRWFAGMNVVVLEDNDATGHAHVEEVAASLHGTAASVKVLTFRELPEHADVSDWLNQGHREDELLALVEATSEWQPPAEIIDFPTQPAPADDAVTVLAEDSVEVQASTPLGLVRFTFSDMEKSARDLDAEMQVQMLQLGTCSESYSQRINLLSMSARDGCRRELEALFGKDVKWAAVLAQTFSRAQEAFLGLDRSISVAILEPPERMTFLIEGIVPDEGVTIPFGAGTSLKTFITMDWAICMAAGVDWLGHVTQQQNVLFIDYETGPKMFGLRLRRLLEGRGLALADVPNLHYWPGNGIPFPDQVDALRRCIARHNIGVLFLDHAAVACGGEPEKAETASRFYRAQGKLKLPMIAIAHITGDGERDQSQVLRPFGSIFWSNEARRSWYVRKASQGDGETLAEVGFFRRKVNDGPAPPDFGLHVRFDDPSGPIRVQHGNLRASDELTESRVGAEHRIYAKLSGLMDTVEIAKATGLSNDWVFKVMSKHPELFDCVEDGGGRGHPAKWLRVDQGSSTGAL